MSVLAVQHDPARAARAALRLRAHPFRAFAQCPRACTACYRAPQFDRKAAGSGLHDTMERLFMGRASAVTYLLGHRRAWLAHIEATSSGSVERAWRHVETIDRLVLDVRAGRVRALELAEPKPVTIFVTD